MALGKNWPGSERVNAYWQNVAMPTRTYRIAYLNVTHDKLARDEGNGYVSSYAERGQFP